MPADRDSNRIWQLARAVAQLERDVRDLTHSVKALRDTVDQMSREDEINRRVEARTAASLQHADARGWTRRERTIAVVTCLCIATDTVLGIIALIGR